MRRILWILALTAVGDGVVTAVMPRRHVRRWAQGPGWYRSAMRPLATHPQSTRLLGVVEAIGGLLWTHKMSDRPE